MLGQLFFLLKGAPIVIFKSNPMKSVPRTSYWYVWDEITYPFPNCTRSKFYFVLLFLTQTNNIHNFQGYFTANGAENLHSGAPKTESRHNANFVVTGCIVDCHDITMTSQWMRWRLKLSAWRLFTQAFIQAQIKENIKAPRHWSLCGEFTGDRWIPRTKGQ